MEQITEGRYDARNQLNDLTGKQWLKLTKSFWASEKCAADKSAFAHPAPFLIKDIEKLISMFTKKGMVVLDPFMGSGTTMIAALRSGRKCIGIDLSEEYRALAMERLSAEQLEVDASSRYILGNSLAEINGIEEVDYIVTSPPYHNILKNNSKGIRENKSDRGYRSGSREGVDYYSENIADLGNQETYEDFLELLKSIMLGCYKKVKARKYCSIIVSDFTVNKSEVCAQGDVVRIMQEIGFEFVGTIVLLQDNKPLYPFGYPYSFVINHMHQNIINFRKPGE